MNARRSRILAYAVAICMASMAAVPVRADETSTGQPTTKTNQQPPKVPGLLKKMDASKDGTVSRDEFMRYADSLFTRMDANKDGVVSYDEFMAAGRKPPREKTDGSTDTSNGATTSNPTKTTEPHADARRDAQFKQINKSATGSMTKAEWDAWATALFAEHDKNNDGKLSADEFGKLKMPKVVTKKPT